VKHLFEHRVKIVMALENLNTVLEAQNSLKLFPAKIMLDVCITV